MNATPVSEAAVEVWLKTQAVERHVFLFDMGVCVYHKLPIGQNSSVWETPEPPFKVASPFSREPLFNVSL